MEGCSQFEKFLGNVKLDIRVQIFIEQSILFVAEFADLFRNDLLEFLGPFVCLDLVLSINLQLIKFQKFISCERLISLEIV